MDVKKTLGAAMEKLRGAKYVLLVLLVGLVLLLLPTGGGKEPEKETPETGLPEVSPETELEAKLSDILSLVDGAGQVRVLLTPVDDGERVLARDTETASESRDGETRLETSDSNLVVQRSGGGSEPVEVTYRYPVYRGAVIAAQGAGDARVRLELLEAVKAATGLSGDAIKIVKMK